jgi:hypothetical protein
MKKFFYFVISACSSFHAVTTKIVKDFPFLALVPADIVGKIYLQRFEDKTIYDGPILPKL